MARGLFKAERQFNQLRYECALAEYTMEDFLRIYPSGDYWELLMTKIHAAMCESPDVDDYVSRLRWFSQYQSTGAHRLGRMEE